MPVHLATAIAPFSTEEAAAGEAFLRILATDADVRRRYLEADHDFVAVAQLITEQTGAAIAPENLPSIAKHLMESHGEAVERLAHDYPSMNVVMDARHEGTNLVEPYSQDEADAADRFVALLASDADVRRRYLEADHDAVAVARVIAEATGCAITPVNLLSITKHLIENRSKSLGQLVNDYPAMNMIIQVNGR